MPVYVFENAKGERIEEVFPMLSIPRSIKREGKVYKRVLTRPAMAVQGETPDRYIAWFNSDTTQARLKSGDLQIMSKSDDANHL